MPKAAGSLHCHQVAGSEDGLFDDRGATLLWTIQQLPALLELYIPFEGLRVDLPSPISNRYGLPQCKQLATLHSRSLTRLEVHMLNDTAEDNTLRLSGLPELRSVTLQGKIGLPTNIVLDAASFQGAPKLQALQLRFDEGLQFQDGTLQELAALTALTVEECGLRSVPANLASLSATLRVLDLSSNDHLQLDAAAVDSICGCSQLRTFDLYKRNVLEWREYLANDAWQELQQHMTRAGYVPAQLSLESVMQLMRLPVAFREQHGRDLHVILALSDYRASECWS